MISPLTFTARSPVESEAHGADTGVSILHHDAWTDAVCAVLQHHLGSRTLRRDAGFGGSRRGQGSRHCTVKQVLYRRHWCQVQEIDEEKPKNSQVVLRTWLRFPIVFSITWFTNRFNQNQAETCWLGAFVSLLTWLLMSSVSFWTSFSSAPLWGWAPDSPSSRIQRSVIPRRTDACENEELRDWERCDVCGRHAACWGRQNKQRGVLLARNKRNSETTVQWLRCFQCQFQIDARVKVNARCGCLW